LAGAPFYFPITCQYRQPVYYLTVFFVPDADKAIFFAESLTFFDFMFGIVYHMGNTS